MAREFKSYVIADFYKSYIDSVGSNRIFVVDEKTFRSIVYDYFKHISSEVIEKAREVKLPGRMGTIKIVKTRPSSIARKNLRVDFKATRELNKTILHLNEHSNGFNYRFFWSKKDIIVRNKTLYEFIPSRANKRLLASLIKNNKSDYIEI